MNATPMLAGAGPSTARPIDEERGIEAIYATGHWLLSDARSADGASVFRAMALLAPTDERSWLGLGACHEALGQPDLALKMYATGRALARRSVRCDLARVRLLRAADRDDEAEAILELAAEAAETLDDETLIALVLAERRVR